MDRRTKAFLDVTNTGMGMSVCRQWRFVGDSDGERRAHNKTGFAASGGPRDGGGESGGERSVMVGWNQRLWPV